MACVRGQAGDHGHDTEDNVQVDTLVDAQGLASLSMPAMMDMPDNLATTTGIPKCLLHYILRSHVLAYDIFADQDALEFDFNPSGNYNMANAIGPFADWDLSMTHDLFDLGTDTDFVYQDIDVSPDFSGPNGETVASSNNSGDATNGIQRHAQAASVFEAFQRSSGRWKPGQGQNRVDEEKDLSLGESASTPMACLGPWNIQVFSQTLDSRLRDRLLAIIARSCDRTNLLHLTSAFPSAEILDRLMKAFMTRHFESPQSFIHIPTFCIKDAHSELLIACIANAAVMSSSRAVRQFGLSIFEFLVDHIKAVVSAPPLRFFECRSPTN